MEMEVEMVKSGMRESLTETECDVGLLFKDAGGDAIFTNWVLPPVDDAHNRMDVSII
jgi:hypothetical protein